MYHCRSSLVHGDRVNHDEIVKSKDVAINCAIRSLHELLTERPDLITGSEKSRAKAALRLVLGAT